MYKRYSQRYMRYIKRCAKNIFRPAVVAVLLLLMISGYALFVQPLVGLADNGDFGRIMLPNDLRHETEREQNDYFGYFNHSYDRLQYYNDVKGNVISTHSILIKLAMAVDDIFSRDHKFDIRFAAVISLTVLAVALYWIVEVVSQWNDRKAYQYAIALLAVVIFGDIGYTVYFNSFFGEAVAYPFFLLSVAVLLKIAFEDRIRVLYIVIYCLSSLMFMGAKSQFALNGILSCVLLVAVLALNVRKNTKLLTAFAGVFLLVSSVFLYVVIDDTIYLINKYHMVTRGVMLFEPDVERVAEAIGIDPQFSLLAETIYFDRTPVIDPEDELLLEKFYANYSLASVTLYYLQHPEAFEKIMDLGWKNSFTIRPEVLGNYERASGREYGERTNFFAVWSYIKENRIPHSSNFAYFLLVIFLALSANRIITERRNDKRTSMKYFSELVMVFVFLTGLTQVLISFIGAGDTDLKKHLFMTTVSLDILFFYYFSYALSLLIKDKPRATKEG